MRLRGGCIALAALAAAAARAQEIEPRQYANTPVGINFLLSGFAYTHGGLEADSSLPLSNTRLDTSAGVLGYARSLDFGGHSGKVDASATYSWLDGSANYDGEPVKRVVDGFSDVRLRMSVNLHGAPALRLGDFKSYRQDLIIGAAFQVSAPTGQYDATRLVNIGNNRWSFKPSLGVSKAKGPWVWEATAAATFYTDNDEFFGGGTLSREPLYSMQAHVIRAFPSGLWASMDATFYTGGRTTVNDIARNDSQRNWRFGATLAVPVTARNAIKFFASDGVSARAGYSYGLFGVVWQYRWGGGI